MNSKFVILRSKNKLQSISDQDEEQNIALLQKKKRKEKKK